MMRGTKSSRLIAKHLLSLVLISVCLISVTFNTNNAIGAEAFKLPSFLSWMQPSQQQQLQHQQQQQPIKSPDGQVQASAGLRWPQRAQLHADKQQAAGNLEDSMVASASNFEAARQQPGGTAKARGLARNPFQSMLGLPGKQHGQNLFSSLPKSLFGRLLSGASSAIALPTATPTTPGPIANLPAFWPASSQKQQFAQFGQQQLPKAKLPFEMTQIAGEPSAYNQAQFFSQDGRAARSRNPQLLQQQMHLQQQQQLVQGPALGQQAKQHEGLQNEPMSKEHALGFGENEDFIVMEPQQVEEAIPTEPLRSGQEANQQKGEKLQLEGKRQQQQTSSSDLPGPGQNVTASTSGSSDANLDSLVDSMAFNQANETKIGSSDNSNAENSTTLAPMSSSESLLTRQNSSLELPTTTMPFTMTTTTTTATALLDDSDVSNGTATLQPPQQSTTTIPLRVGLADEATDLAGQQPQVGEAAGKEEPLETPESGRLESAAPATFVAASEDGNAPISGQMQQQQQHQQQRFQAGEQQQQPQQHQAHMPQPEPLGAMMQAAEQEEDGRQFESFVIGPYDGQLGNENEAAAQFRELVQSQAFPRLALQKQAQQAPSSRPSLLPVGMASSLIQSAKSLIQLPFVHMSGASSSFRGQPTSNQQLIGEAEQLLEQSSSLPVQFAPFGGHFHYQQHHHTGGQRIPSMIQSASSPPMASSAGQSKASSVPDKGGHHYRMPRPFFRLHQQQQHHQWPMAQIQPDRRPAATAPLRQQQQPPQGAYLAKGVQQQQFLMPNQRPQVDRPAYAMQQQQQQQQLTRQPVQVPMQQLYNQRPQQSHPLNAISASQANGFHLVVDHGNRENFGANLQQRQQQQQAGGHSLGQQQQQQQRFKSGFYQIDAPKLVEQGAFVGATESEQQQQQQQVAIPDSEPIEQQQKEPADGDEEADEEDDDEQQQQQQLRLNSSAAPNQQQQQLARQVGATIGVASNETSSQRRGQVKGQVFSEPVSGGRKQKGAAILASGSNPRQQTEEPSSGQNYTETRALKYAQDVTLYDIEVPQQQQPQLLDTQVYTIPYAVNTQLDGRTQFSPILGENYQQQQQQVVSQSSQLQAHVPGANGFAHASAQRQAPSMFPLPYLPPPGPGPFSARYRQQAQQPVGMSPVTQADYAQAAQAGHHRSLFNEQGLAQASFLPDWTTDQTQEAQQQQQQQQQQQHQPAQAQRYFHYAPAPAPLLQGTASAAAIPAAPVGQQPQQSATVEQVQPQIAAAPAAGTKGGAEQVQRFDMSQSVAQQPQQFMLAIQHDASPSGGAIFSTSFMGPQSAASLASGDNFQSRASTTTTTTSSTTAAGSSGDLIAEPVTMAPESAPARQQAEERNEELQLQRQLDKSADSRQTVTGRQQRLDASFLEQNDDGASSQNLRLILQQAAAAQVGESAPKTPSTFCADRAPGLYADVGQRCKAYYQCAPTGHQMFRCNNQTQFNQKTQNCDWWYNVDCGGRLGSPLDFEEAATATNPTISVTAATTQLADESAKSAQPDTQQQQQQQARSASASTNSNVHVAPDQGLDGADQQQQRRPISPAPRDRGNAEQADNSRWPGGRQADNEQQQQQQQQQQQPQVSAMEDVRRGQQAEVATRSDFGGQPTSGDFLERAAGPTQQELASLQIGNASPAPVPNEGGASIGGAASGPQPATERSAGLTDSEAASVAVGLESVPRVGALGEEKESSAAASPSTTATTATTTTTTTTAAAAATSGESSTAANEQPQDESDAAQTTATTTTATTSQRISGEVSPAGNNQRRTIQSEFGSGVQQQQQQLGSLKSARSAANSFHRFESARSSAVAQGNVAHLAASANGNKLDALAELTSETGPAAHSNHRYAAEQQQQHIYSTSANQGSVSYMPATTADSPDQVGVGGKVARRLGRRFGARLAAKQTAAGEPATTTTTTATSTSTSARALAAQAETTTTSALRSR